MAEWTGSRRPSRRSRMAEEESKAMRRVTPDQPEAPGAVVSPQHPGTVPDRSTIPGHWAERVPPAGDILRPLTEYGTTQHIADVYAPSGEGGVWTVRDFEQGPVPYEELRRADPRLLPPERPVPGYETGRALAQAEERAALAAGRQEALAAHAESAATAGGQADHAISGGQAAQATDAGSIDGAKPAAQPGTAAGAMTPEEAPPTAAEIAEIPSGATPLAAAGAASGPPAAGETWTGQVAPGAPVLPPDQQTTSRTGLAAPAEAVANAAAAVAPPSVPHDPDKVVGPVGVGQADQDRYAWAKVGPDPGLRTGVAEAIETGATGTAAPGVGGGEVPAAPVAPATDEVPDARPADVTPFDVLGGQLDGLQAAAADVPADLPTPAEGWSAGGGSAVQAGTVPTAPAADAPSGRTGDIAPGGPSPEATGWGTTDTEASLPPDLGSSVPEVGPTGARGIVAAGSPPTSGSGSGSGRPSAGGESFVVVPSGGRGATAPGTAGGRRDIGTDAAIVAPESEPEPPRGQAGGGAAGGFERGGVFNPDEATRGVGVVAGPGVAEGGFRPTTAPVARDVEPAGGPIDPSPGGRTTLDPTPAPVTPEGSVASVAEAGVIGAEAVPIGTPRSVGGDRPALAEAPPNAVRGSGKKHCPSGYPVKGNARSKKFHLPQYGSYDQIAPEFCFKSAEAAEAAGYAPARKH